MKKYSLALPAIVNTKLFEAANLLLLPHHYTMTSMQDTTGPTKTKLYWKKKGGNHKALYSPNPKEGPAL
jgi:hypothetical protein